MVAAAAAQISQAYRPYTYAVPSETSNIRTRKFITCTLCVWQPATSVTSAAVVRAAWLNSDARLVYSKPAIIIRLVLSRPNERRYSEFAAALTNGHDSRRDVINTSAILTKNFGLVALCCARARRSYTSGASVRPAHAGRPIESKRMIIGLCGLHHKVALGLFLDRRNTMDSS